MAYTRLLIEQTLADNLLLELKSIDFKLVIYLVIYQIVIWGL